MEIRPLPLDRALRVEPDANGNWPCVAFVGAGGKTTALFQLARELARRAGGALVTTTTHLGMGQAMLSDRSFQISSAADMAAGLAELRHNETGLFTGPALLETQRLSGLEGSLLHQLWSAAQARHVPLLVEADGAQRKPLKAPAAYEPAIPDCANLVVVCVGLSGLGQLLVERVVHRAQLFAELADLHPEHEITPQALVRLLLHPQGGLKNIPPGTRRVLLLNQADSPALEGQARWIAEQVLGDYAAVLVGALAQGGILHVWEPSAAVVLAAGGARRFGRPKQLLEIEGQPLVRRVARLALAAGLHPVKVVCGAYSSEVRQALDGLAVECVENPDWELGQSTSLRAGLLKLPDGCSGAVFLLADQPYVSLDIILALVQAHAQSLAPVVAPRVGDQRANPVYFDRVTFPDLLELEGDIGGRAVIRSGRHRVEWLDWLDTALLEDIDTPEDYDKLLHSD